MAGWAAKSGSRASMAFAPAAPAGPRPSVGSVRTEGSTAPPGPMWLLPDMPVDATDGHVGRLADVVVDPVARRVTHVVVRRAHSVNPRSHLVPLAACRVQDARLHLTWTREELTATEPVDETDFVELGGWPHDTDDWDVGIVRVVSWPRFPATGRFLEPAGPEDTDTLVEFDHLPHGTVEIRRESEVFSSDHDVVGHVEGFEVDADADVTHLLVRRHHLLGHDTFRISVEDVASITSDAVYLALTHDRVDAARSDRG